MVVEKIKTKYPPEFGPVNAETSFLQYVFLLFFYISGQNAYEWQTIFLEKMMHRDRPGKNSTGTNHYS
jgi:hypothetical protein